MIHLNGLMLSLGFMILLGLIWFGVSFFRLGHVSAKFSKKMTDAITYTTTPTLFVHGYRGNRYSFGRMLQRFSRSGIAQKALVVRVTKNGTFKFSGDWQFESCNPCIQVLFQKNKATVVQQVQWLAKLLAFFKTQNIDTVNLVGHSMGAVTVTAYCGHCFGSTQPKVNKVVTIAGPFNDLELGRDEAQISGYPLTKSGPKQTTPIYEDLSKYLPQIPYKIEFLNIVGDILPAGHLAHDGSVATSSGLALKYILQSTKHKYIQALILGANAAHSLLHENSLVDWDMIDFLWARAVKNKS